MKTIIIKSTIVMATTIIFYNLYFVDDEVEVKEEIARTQYLEIENDPVFIAGCKAFHGPVPPKVIYPTVKKNFIALTCALEVYPPHALMALRRNYINQATQGN